MLTEGFLWIIALFLLRAFRCTLLPNSNSLLRSQQEILPEQIHLSWSGDPSEMLVTWATLAKSNSSILRYGLADGQWSTTVSGTQTCFVDGAIAHKKRYIHRASFNNLTAATRYYYQCGNDGGWSVTFSFRSLQNGTDWSPRLLIFGDMGVKNAKSLKQMTKEVLNDQYDLVLHIGDFAYDLQDKNGDVGDEFLRNLQPLAAMIPYQVVVGNHEEKFNFSHYKNRFTTPGKTDGMYYSFEVGPLHMSVISTEFYFFPRYGIKQIYDQFYWFAKDLTLAKQNTDLGWIFVAGHRPMYCSNPDIVDCNPRGNIFRKGISLFQLPGLEDIMHENGVDIALWAHEHSYERTWPIYNLEVLNGSVNEPYTDPRGIVHIITGSAGCKENHTRFNPHPFSFSAFRSEDYGYTRMTVFNKTHVHFEQVSDDQGNIVIDSVWIRKTTAGKAMWLRN